MDLTVQSDDLEKLHDWMTAMSSEGAIAVITHKNGDMDTIGSSIALASTFPQCLACGLHLNRVSKIIIKTLSAPFRILSKEHILWPKSLAGIVVVDASSPSQIGFDLPKNIPLCIIDHHDTNEWKITKRDISIIWPVSATTQIIHAYLEKYHSVCLTEEVRKLLLAGLITDTGRFRHANVGSFLTGVKLLQNSEIDYHELVERMESVKMNSSDRGAITKAISKVESLDVGEWYLLKTYASTLESRVCSILLLANADVVLVSKTKNSKTRLTARANKSATSRGLHLGNLMQLLSKNIGGDGGGHDGAAGWSGDVGKIEAESAFINALSSFKVIGDL